MREDRICSYKFEAARNNSSIDSERGPKKRFKDWTEDGITHKELTATQCQRHKSARSQSPNELYKFGAAMNNPKQLRATRATERLN